MEKPPPPQAVALFAGGITPIGDEGHVSGIRKRPIVDPVELTTLGLAGDDIVDRRFHGGPDKALNIFPREHYPWLNSLFAQPDEPLVPGGLGENISCLGLHEDEVRIGDVFAIGSAVIEVSQPRAPCWKINARFGIESMAATLQAHRRTGWYARVLQPGVITACDEMQRLRRAPDLVTIAELWQLLMARKPDPQRLAALAQSPILAGSWREKINQRLGM